MSNVHEFPSAKCNRVTSDGYQTVSSNFDTAISEIERRLFSNTELAVQRVILSIEGVNVEIRRVINCISDGSIRQIVLEQLATIERQIGTLRAKCTYAEDFDKTVRGRTAV